MLRSKLFISCRSESSNISLVVLDNDRWQTQTWQYFQMFVPLISNLFNLSPHLSTIFTVPAEDSFLQKDMSSICKCASALGLILEATFPDIKVHSSFSTSIFSQLFLLVIRYCMLLGNQLRYSFILGRICLWQISWIRICVKWCVL